MMRFVTSATTLAIATTGALLFSPTTSSGAPVEERARTTPTAFALNGSGYGSRLVGGDLPAGSDTTSWQSIGCTNEAGKDQENHLTTVTLPGLGELGEVTTRVWTTSAKGVVSSWSRNSIERAVLGDATTGQIELNGIISRSRAFHDGKAFKADATTSVASLTYFPAAGAPQELDVPTPGQPVEIPGVATISVGNTVTRANSERAKTLADAVLVEMTLSGTKVRLAHSEAQIFEGVKSGVFRGRSAGVQGRGLDDNVSIGYQPLSLMPCQGTDGELRRKSILRLDLGEDMTLRGVSSRQQSDQTNTMATGFERGRVDTVDLNNGQLMITKVVGRVNVTRTAKGIERNVKGTTIGEITADGEPQEFPDSGVLEIPGVARLERGIVRKIRNGMAVTSLRITLLDGSGAVIDLGEAKLSIRDSGR